ncbi:hypothetical protein KP509_10G080800 [Ceratopteris richardii]|uniref:Uncharacterized protein n=1 Tax=Ceratopteris richardii TaxID=49495 RepID=A0A8T2TZ24_CERRI|nr:hypothetical protein KP509_10G080800 [Ceratopteris richardii]
MVEALHTVEVREGAEVGFFQVHVRCPTHPSLATSILIAIERKCARLTSVNLIMQPSISIDVTAEKMEGITDEDMEHLKDVLICLIEETT